MGLGAMAALTGLSKSVDRVAETQREFATMENLQNDIAKDEQASMMAQELEAKQYEEIANKAAEMLAPDRVKIQAKSLELQKEIRSKIEEYGSRKAFYENGGIALLSKYKSGVLTSPETLSYLDNKKNMETLLKIQESGKGHLISERDLKSMADYNNGVGDGKITYGGLKAEVKIPHEFFNYQEEIPAGNILAFGSNKMAIYGNWLLENPDKKYLTGEALENELELFTMNNYSGMGSNQLRYQQDLARKYQKEDEERTMKLGTEEDDIPISLVSEMNNGFTSGKEVLPATLDNVMSDENYTQKMARLNPGLTAIAGSIIPYNDFNSNSSSADSNWVTGSQWIDKGWKKLQKATNFDMKYKLAGAAIVPVQNHKGVIDFLYPGSPNVGAVSVTLDQSKFYSANGQLLKKEYVEENNNQEPMKYGGLIYAFVDGNGKIVTKPLDSDGKPLGKIDKKTGKYSLSDEEKDHRKAYSGNLTHEMFAVLTTADGDKIYQKIGADSLAGEAALTAAIGTPDNLTNKVKSRAKLVKRKNEIIAQSKYDSKLLKYEASVASAENGIFNTPEFKADVKSGTVGDGSERTILTKAYYMAATAMNNNGAVGNDLMLNDGIYKRGNAANFTKAVNYSNELKNALINKKKVNDVDFIKLFTKIHSDGTPEHAEENQQAGELWIHFYELLNKK